MILMIDNYDSFTYNLVQYLGEMGEELVVRRNDKIDIEEIETVLKPAMIMISPGPCTPNEAGISLDVIRTFSGRIPILGVCLGHQAIAQAFGGVVKKADQLMHGKTSYIQHDKRTLFEGLPESLRVTRYHSLIVERETLPSCFDISAETASGEIMAIRHKEYALEGVQFHPEAILTTEGKRMLRQFVETYKGGVSCTLV
ncbi:MULTISPECIES: aminodeoxychorismate/anthranilate synthase component II [Shouchella]|uniref:Para-aminobenzoate/anthranilate synthase glutamine amidotransferase component II n=3 Tax=Bacillaceae TaxID=186817 RepID=A0A060M2J8_9BACI|nr:MULTISPECIES: aminodeoxychorismate/anthranilate synthase component II [Bacillaceae]RQW18120.1 aminodeoxychorismate/anthranilate synthase component II [Bacillus sp. C1-1]AIC96632.1 Para-aminobenzoate/anthranilate synthase glutamine amidotransferase component II [Shouchella lehensis G1]KQL51655.1 anthranilate synthase [Alkalicoccobacillus plakortidis]MBG9782365.1 anthranilate synthase component II [Shouchella lehensis]TES46898.1 aminodeoxychorismate/anthranilate synthase component II [Shouche